MAIYVLIHGSFTGGWIWKPVATRLRAAGHSVYTPTLDGCAERRHQLRPGITTTSQAQEVADFLFCEDLQDIVLVSTSSGGMVASTVATLARERIKHLVYVDALVPQPGETVADIVPRKRDAAAYETTELARGYTRAYMENDFFADLAPETRAWALERYTLHPKSASNAPLDEFWAQSWSATVINCLRSPNPVESHQRRTAEKLAAAWHELDAGHFPMLSHPAELTRLLLQV